MAGVEHMERSGLVSGRGEMDVFAVLEKAEELWEMRHADLGDVCIYPKLTQETFYYLPVNERVKLLFPDYVEVMQKKYTMPATVDDIRRFNKIHPGYNKTGLLGLSWEELCRDGNGRILLGSLFETKSWPVATAMADVLIEKVIEHFGVEKIQYLNHTHFYEIGTGAGSLTASLVQVAKQKGLRPVVTSVERNPRVAKYTAANFRHLDINHGSVDIVGINAIEHMRDAYIKDELGEGEYHHVALMMDPPWRASFYGAGLWAKDLRDIYLVSDERIESEFDRDWVTSELEAKKERCDFDIETLERGSILNAEEVIMLAINQRIAPIIAMHVPTNFDNDELRESAERMGLNLEIVLLDGYDGNRHLEEKLVIFTKPEKNQAGLIYDARVVKFPKI